LKEQVSPHNKQQQQIIMTTETMKTETTQMESTHAIRTDLIAPSPSTTTVQMPTVTSSEVQARLNVALQKKQRINRSGDLVPLSKEFETIRTNLRHLIDVNKTYYRSMTQMEKSRMDSVDTMSLLLHKTPFEEAAQRDVLAHKETSTKMHELMAYYQTEVIDYLVRMEHFLSERVNSERAQVRELRSHLNHYKSKVTKLRRKTHKKQDTGKEITSSKAQKLERNEKKLEKAWLDHEIKASRLCDLLEEIVHFGWKDLYQVISKMIHFEHSSSEVHKEMTDKLSVIKTDFEMIYNDSSDGNLSVSKVPIAVEIEKKKEVTVPLDMEGNNEIAGSALREAFIEEKMHEKETKKASDSSVSSTANSSFQSTDAVVVEQRVDVIVPEGIEKNDAFVQGAVKEALHDEKVLQEKVLAKLNDKEVYVKSTEQQQTSSSEVPALVKDETIPSSRVLPHLFDEKAAAQEKSMTTERSMAQTSTSGEHPPELVKDETILSSRVLPHLFDEKAATQEKSMTTETSTTEKSVEQTSTSGEHPPELVKDEKILSSRVLPHLFDEKAAQEKSMTTETSTTEKSINQTSTSRAHPPELVKDETVLSSRVLPHLFDEKAVAANQTSSSSTDQTTSSSSYGNTPKGHTVETVTTVEKATIEKILEEEDLSETESGEHKLHRRSDSVSSSSSSSSGSSSDSSVEGGEKEEAPKKGFLSFFTGSK
jgi:hypothetical protein